MAAASKNFVVVHLVDIDEWGFDEVTLPMLLRLVDEGGADDRSFTHLGVTGCFLADPPALGKVERLVAEAESLRDGDLRFRSLGIGISHGRLLAEGDRKGRLRQNRPPMGTVATHAMQAAKSPGACHRALEALRGAAAAPGGLRAEIEA